MESRARLGGEVGEEEEEVPFACYYHSMCQAVYKRLQAASAGDRRTVHGQEEACWTSDKSVLGQTFTQPTCHVLQT